MLLAPDIVCVFLNIFPLTKEQSQGPATELMILAVDPAPAYPTASPSEVQYIHACPRRW